MRTFDTGATRDGEDGKLDYEGFLSPLALEVYAEFMNANRVQADGQLRDSDNWQKGIPIESYRKSLLRHVFAAWKLWRGYRSIDERGRAQNLTDELCAILFNTQGLLHEMVKAERVEGDSWIERCAR
jgi:hypothetical protein